MFAFCSKFTISTVGQCVIFFKVNNKDARAMCGIC